MRPCIGRRNNGRERAEDKVPGTDAVIFARGQFPGVQVQDELALPVCQDPGPDHGRVQRAGSDEVRHDRAVLGDGRGVRPAVAGGRVAEAAVVPPPHARRLADVRIVQGDDLDQVFVLIVDEAHIAAAVRDEVGGGVDRVLQGALDHGNAVLQVLLLLDDDFGQVLLHSPEGDRLEAVQQHVVVRFHGTRRGSQVHRLIEHGDRVAQLHRLQDGDVLILRRLLQRHEGHLPGDLRLPHFVRVRV